MFFLNKTKRGVRPFTAKMIINLVMKNVVVTNNFSFSIYDMNSMKTTCSSDCKGCFPGALSLLL